MRIVDVISPLRIPARSGRLNCIGFPIFFSFANAQAVAIGVGECDFTRPGLLLDLDSELSCNGVNIVDIEVDQRVGASVTFVFGQVQMDVSAAQKQVERQCWCKAVLALDHKAEASIPFSSFVSDRKSVV